MAMRFKAWRVCARNSRLLQLIALTLCVISTPSIGKSPPAPPMPPGMNDPGTMPEGVLSKVVNKLRQTLKDPYSIRDMTLCPPDRIDAYYNGGLGSWVQAHWSVKITLNSKNSYGGYTGSTLFAVDFDKGEATDITQFHGFDLLPAEANAKIVESAQRCPRVPDAEIQRLLTN